MEIDSLDSLLERKSAIQERLKEIAGTPLPAKEATDVVKVDYHWDILMKEMKWLSNDFSNERTRLRNNCKKIAKAVDSYHKTKDVRLAKRVKDEGLQLKKVVFKNAKDIRKFWIKINKVVAFKQKIDADAVRQKAMDKHLVFLVKQTEMYTNRLAENMHSKGDDTPGSPSSAAGSSTASAKSHTRCFHESEMSIGDISDIYSMSEAASDADDDDSFVVSGEEEEDNESTLLEEEEEHRGRQQAGEEVSYARELEMLQEEGEMSVEALRALYYGSGGGSSPSDTESSGDGNDNDGSIAENANEESGIESTAMDIEDGLAADATGEKESDNSTPGVDDAMRRLELVDAAARSYEVDIPYGLSPKLRLRQYQHIGLSWLVSLHERRLNGILADEMGLGKTIQTISLLAYLAVYRGLWGPHLIIVPTSCIVNWEVEFKKWCPIFKVLTYYGSTKRRKSLRVGWSKLNSFHVVITSYQLVVQDASAFKRKRWYYMILDEAHNIKNFKSQRWQVLLNFNTQRRLLLTGTPLQNNLMELWALMHFLMPHIFRSRKEFSYWFSNPLTGMIEGNSGINNDLINRLHGIMRPFLLRRLKKDVEKQLPGKFEHIVMCKLSRRQQFLYEEFMSRSSTRSMMSGGGFMGMMNILMQLRKVCNHPDLFEPRPILSAFVPDRLEYSVSALVLMSRHEHPFRGVSKSFTQLWDMSLDDLTKDSMNKLSVSKEMFMNVNIDDVNMDVPSYLLLNSRYRTLIDEMRNAIKRQKLDKASFNGSLNIRRCDPFAINMANWRVVRSLSLTEPVLQKMFEPELVDFARFELPSALFGLVKSVSKRAEELIPIFERFVFVLAKVKAEPVLMCTGKGTVIADDAEARAILKPAIATALKPYYDANIRQQMYFPDRKLVQFDSGKLQTLCTLLHERKKGGHKCLIFTQMSKMLDILEAFLNIHGHTYVRLDGSTTVDRRQKLMDRFNNDPKLFCFILSTRSGGFGINLTGADSVIFYDSDWNPAMDAQAQDRAHRIGQTREVHIYRLVCSSTIEENILVKAKQKQHLDHLVMTEGNFSEEALFNSTSVKDMLGIKPVDDEGRSENMKVDEGSVDNIEAAMAAAEDEEDVFAMRGARAELAKEGDEFDEAVAPVSTTASAADPADGEDDTNDIEAENEPEEAATDLAVTMSTEEALIEAEFENWQKKVGNDFNAIENALKPIERYAYRFNTVVEPYYSPHFLLDQQRMSELATENSQQQDEWNVLEIEKMKEEDEVRALEGGELIWAPMSVYDVKSLKRWYLRARDNRKREARRRLMTGEAWAEIIDPVTQMPFWYNEDTGDASYGAPPIVVAQRNFERARERGFMALSDNILNNVMQMLEPMDRMKTAAVCAHWRVVASDESFHLKVLPVEAGVSIQDKGSGELQGMSVVAAASDKVFVSLAAAVSAARPGDTIDLCAGHFWDECIEIDRPIRIIGCLQEPSKCSVEISKQLIVKSGTNAVVLAGISLSRPRKIPTSKSIITAENAVLHMYCCNVNNRDGQGCGISLRDYSVLRMYSCSIMGAAYSGVQAFGSDICCMFSSITHNESNGVTLVDSSFSASDCYISKNVSRGVRGYGRCVIALSHCDISGNGVSPAVSIDEKQDLSHAGEDAIICIRDSVGDVVSDPPSMKWAGAENNTTSYTLNGEQITINAIIGQSLELYWPADDTWYTGKVEGYNPETNEYTVVYAADECVEYVDLSKEQYRFIDRPDLCPPDLSSSIVGSKRSFQQLSQDGAGNISGVITSNGAPRSTPMVSPKTLLLLAQQKLAVQTKGLRIGDSVGSDLKGLVKKEDCSPSMKRAKVEQF